MFYDFRKRRKDFSNGFLTIVLAVSLLFLEACNNHDQIIKPVPQPSAPLGVLPKTLCANNFADGYTDKISYKPGEEIKLYLNGEQAIENCRLDVYSMNGTLAFSIPSSLPIQNPPPQNASAEGFGYLLSSKFAVPAIASGVYLIENKIPFIIKSTQVSDLLIVYPSNTANAYCSSGGQSLYSAVNRPYQVSFHRPIAAESFSEYCLRWFTTLDQIKIAYVADFDLEDFSNIADAKIVAIIGHSEYWTRLARTNFDKFVANGGNALILSGNTMWWQVRYSDDQNKLICFKDLSDPHHNPLLKTLTWDTQSLQYPIINSTGADFNHGGYGLKSDNGWNGYKIALPNSPLLEGINFQKGNILKLPTVEYDGAPLKGYANGFPVIDTEALNFTKIELLGFDRGFRVSETVGTFIVFRRTPSSGIIINTASTDWCSSNGMGGESADKIKKITYNAITKLLRGDAVFAE
jgi:hypothetical protein